MTLFSKHHACWRMARILEDHKLAARRSNATSRNRVESNSEHSIMTENCWGETITIRDRIAKQGCRNLLNYCTPIIRKYLYVICLPQFTTLSAYINRYFPKQFTVGVLNAVLSVSALAGMLCPPRWSCLSLVSGLVSHLVWDAVSASPVVSFSCLRPCLPACLPSGLGCCFRLAGRVFLLSPVLSPSLSPIWSGMLCPPRWSCLSLVSGLFSQLVSHLVWDAVSALGCCVCRAGLVFSLIFGLVSHLV